MKTNMIDMMLSQGAPKTIILGMITDVITDCLSKTKLNLKLQSISKEGDSLAGTPSLVKQLLCLEQQSLLTQL